MRQIALVPVLAALLGAPLSPALASDDLAALTDQAQAIVKAFGGTLKGELENAKAAGGPVKAIEVCNTRAVPLADFASADSGWSVGRTSHRLRNPANAPDSYEQAVLMDFLSRQANGEAAGDLVRAEIVTTADGGSEFRFIKAIPTADACLGCHGSTLKAPIAAKLDTLYPGDAARSFELGAMRGVFTLRKAL